MLWTKDSNIYIPGSTVVNSAFNTSVTRSDLKVSNAMLSNGGLYKCTVEYSVSHVFSVQIEGKYYHYSDIILSLNYVWLKSFCFLL